MGSNMGKEMRERLLMSLEEATVPFRISKKTARFEDGWLRGVRLAVGMPVKELARRQGVVERVIFRQEQMERKSHITLWALRRAAEAMGCELSYVLIPKRGTLSEMAAERSSARDKAQEKRRVEADDRRSEEGKPRRRHDPKLAAIRTLLLLAEFGSETVDSEQWTVNE
jgi:hypothetical protein